MKSKFLNFLLVISSLIGYLEWGENNYAFLYELEGDILSKLLTEPTSVAHPFTLLPLIGQLMLIITLFQKQPNKKLTYLGIAGIGLLLGLMFMIGIIELNFKIILSTIPFITIAILAIHEQRSLRTK